MHENIISRRDVANSADWLRFVYEHELKKLKDIVLDSFRRHTKDIMKTEGFEMLMKKTPSQLVVGELFKTFLL